MASGRAQKGGELGMNGEFYAGGTFLPNTRLPKRGARPRVQRVTRMLVEPGIFASPLGHVSSIFSMVRELAHVENGVLVANFSDDHPAMQTYYGRRIEEFHALLAAYNAGRRFVDMV